MPRRPDSARRKTGPKPISPVRPDSARFITPEIFDRTAYKKNYNRGRAASQRWGGTFPSPIERADDRGEAAAWYDGYLDYAAGREKWHGPDGRRKEVAHTVTRPDRPSQRRALSVPDQHRLKIARDTLKMPDAMVGVMGGPTKQEAREIVRELTDHKEK